MLKKPIIETEQTWGACEHCNKRTNLEADFQFIGGEWIKISPFLCKDCQDK